MKKTAIALAVAASIAGIGNVSAASMEDRMLAMEKRLKYLEQRLAAQDKVIAEKEAQINQLSAGSNTSGGGWFQNTEIGGVIDVDAVSIDDNTRNTDDDMVTATVEIGITSQINDWVSGEIVLLYEEDTNSSDGNDRSLQVDTAMVSIADPNANWFINAGQYGLPFGMYPSHMISDPYTLVLGETTDTAAEVGFGANGFTVSAFVFDGDENAQDINSWGAQATYEMEADDFGLVAHLGYISNMNQTDGDLNLAGFNNADGWVVSAEVNTGPFTIMGEYIAATDDLDGSNREPSAWNIEAGYGFEAASMPATIAVGYTETDEHAAYAGDANKEAIRALFALEVMDGTSVMVEYSDEELYGGADNDVLTGRLSVEF